MLVATPALAGGDHAKTCSSPVQECLSEMVTKLKTTGFIGIEYDEKESTNGLKVSKVIPDTAAEKAGIQVGDVLEAMNDISFTKDNHEALARIKVPGKQVTLTLTRAGERQEIQVTLSPMPTDLMAKYIGEHMLVHANKKVATAKR
jgi:C-terminal processing protease CtpA/Prc